MARPRKDNRPVSVRMDQEVFDRLEDFCERSGQSKTTAIERALSRYIDYYDRLLPVIKEAKERQQ